MDKEKIIVIGTGISSGDLTADHLETIRSADLLVGGRRHLARFAALTMEKLAISGDIAAMVATLCARKENQRIVVLASGDPLLFGIGARLAREFGQEAVTVLPNVSSVAAAFARMNEPWEDAKIISLHGRDRRFQLLAALKTDGPVAVLTDPEQTPGRLAGWLMERGLDRGVRMAVFEQLGSVEEKFAWYDLPAAAGHLFAQPNLVILKTDGAPLAAARRLHIGMNAEAYAHENGMITKAEVRAVTLAKLRLTPGLTLWDLGAGSGAVGIEASVLLGPGRIVAVEEKHERVALIKENARRYGVYNHEVVQAKLPEGMDLLPRPDRIFIGGGGRDLAAILQASIELLPLDGIIVTNTVLVDNLTGAIATMAAVGMTAEVVQLQVSRSKAMPWSQRLTAENPVWIISGAKKHKEDE
ncbi:MAG: precorrin-6y C5,15-methyltransferase (decarboxylating) subunit CbiE [Desulfatitalea sp.]